MCTKVIHSSSKTCFDCYYLCFRVVEQHEKEIASSMVMVFLGVGLTLGAGICLILVKVI